MNEEQHRYSIEGKVCVVTGASAGIGQSLCMHLASSGADIIGVGRNLARLATTKAGVNDIGRRFVAVEADLSKVEDIERAAQEMLTAAPQIHVLVNNAGIGANRSLLEETADGFDRMIAINLRAPFLLARALAPQMIARKSGKIINVSSAASGVGMLDHGAYASSKSGLNGLTRVMTAEWGKYNIQCNAICPTVVLTEMGIAYWTVPERYGPLVAKIPAGRVVEIQEVCDLILFLASEASNMINGQAIFLDGGYTAI